MADLVTVTIATGESRTAERYPDGSYGCPWCGAAVASPDHPTYVERGDYPRYMREAFEANACGNPWCFAYPSTTVERIEAERAKQAQRAREEAERKANHERAMARIEAEQQARTDAWTAARAEAERRGACVACLRASAWWTFGSAYNPPDRPDGRAKFVRHRAACPRR